MNAWNTGPRTPDAPGRYIRAHLRRSVMDRDNRMCRYCTVTVANTIDHVYPWSQGGWNDMENLVACCHICNSIAGDRVFIGGFSPKKLYILQRRRELRMKRREHETQEPSVE